MFSLDDVRSEPLEVVRDVRQAHVAHVAHVGVGVLMSVFQAGTCLLRAPKMLRAFGLCRCRLTQIAAARSGELTERLYLLFPKK
jgi:hypothetical protein